MDPLLLVAGIAVLAFDAYAYRIYSRGRTSLDSVYSSSERAFRVKRHFDADQEPAKRAGGDSATVSSAAASANGAAPAVDIHVPFKRSERGGAYAESALATSELVFLRGEVESLRQKLSVVEGSSGKGRARFSAGEIDAKQAELHRMFMRRQISDDTYRTMCSEIAKVRLGL